MEIGICAIGYNRIDSLSRLLTSLNNAVYDQEVSLIISLDKYKIIDIKNYADSFLWEHGKKTVILQEENLGLRRHVLRCGQYMNDFHFDALVILEDDVTVSPYFFSYVRQCVDRYKDDESIAGISLYNYPINYISRNPFTPMSSEYDVFLMNCAMSWGQVWIKEKWEKFMNWYNLNNSEFSLPHLPAPINNWPKSSWLKYHTRYCIENDLYFVYPYRSLSTNNSDPGTHNRERHTFMQSNLECLPRKEWHIPVSSDILIRYDGFFEPKFIYDSLGLTEDSVDINLNGAKGYLMKRYELTTISKPYKVIQSFGLVYKPIEANILLNMAGNNIYLYDTSIPDVKPRDKHISEVMEYYYLNIFEKLCSWSIFKHVLSYFLFFHYRILLKK